MTTGQERKSRRLVADKLTAAARIVSGRVRHCNHLVDDGDSGNVSAGISSQVAEVVESLVALRRALPPAGTSDSILGDVEELATVADFLLLRVRLLLQVDEALGNDKYKNEISRIQDSLGRILPLVRELSNSLGGTAVEVVSDENTLLDLRPRATEGNRPNWK